MFRPGLHGSRVDQESNPQPTHREVGVGLTTLRTLILENVPYMFWAHEGK